jgi:hypothetical protein
MLLCSGDGNSVPEGQKVDGTANAEHLRTVETPANNDAMIAPAELEL